MGLATNPVKVRRLVDLTQMGVEDHGSALATTVSFARAQPEIMDRFVQAFVEAIALGKKDRNLAKRVYAKYLRLTDDNLLDLNHKVYLLGSIPKIPTFPLEALKNVLGDLAEENPKAKEINVEEILDNSFIQRQVDDGFIDRLYRGCNGFLRRVLSILKAPLLFEIRFVHGADFRWLVFVLEQVTALMFTYGREPNRTYPAEPTA
jgi:hypothetical protein